MAFLFLDYKHSHIYWNIFRVLKNIIVIIVTNLMWQQSKMSQGVVLLMFSNFTYLATNRGRPYTEELLNSLELTSLVVTIITSAAGFLSINSRFKELAMAIILFANLIFMVVGLKNGHKGLMKHNSNYVRIVNRVGSIVPIKKETSIKNL